MATLDDFDQVVEQYHSALGEVVKGDPEPLKLLYSHREEVSLANPFFPPVSGWDKAAQNIERAALRYRDGELACVVEVERYRAKVGGREDISPMALRVTSILRPEEGTWKVVHRHADPITTPQPAESVIQN
jgi:hypothetical protein